MFKFIKECVIIIFFTLGLSSLGFTEESITITTYYPSPYGSYSELTTTSGTYLATSSGNVGIGTTSPAAKLEVSGNIKASGGSNGKATCWKGTQIGYCSSVVAADGSCTCN